MITWVVFDLGGVILEVEFARFFEALPCEVQAQARPLGEQIIQVFRDYEDSSGALPPESVFDGIRKLFDYPLTDDQIKSAVNSVLGKQKLDVCTTVSSLTGTVDLACLSNTNHIHWEVLLTAYPVMNHFSVKMASHLLGCSKPDNRIYRTASGILGVPPEQVLFFDDKPENVVAARGCGWNACVFENFANFERDLRAFGVLPPA